MKRIVTLLLCVIAFTVTLHAQEFNKGVKELVNEGEGHFDIDEFDMALKFLLQADK